MKKIVLSFFLIHSFASFAQYPYVIGPCTVTPIMATNMDIVKIITKVSAGQSGIVICDRSQNTNTTINTIDIRACYWKGVTTAPSSTVDTYTIGQLSPGSYSYTFKAVYNGAFSYTDACIPADSNNVTGTFTVALSNGIKENNFNSDVVLTPNPFHDKVQIQSKGLEGYNIIVTDNIGRLVYCEENKLPGGSIDLSALYRGIYYLRISNPKGQKVFKIAKE